MSTKNTRITIRIDEELKKAIQKKAEEENRTISNWVESVIKAAV